MMDPSFSNIPRFDGERLSDLAVAEDFIRSTLVKLGATTPHGFEAVYTRLERSSLSRESVLGLLEAIKDLDAVGVDEAHPDGITAFHIVKLGCLALHGAFGSHPNNRAEDLQADVEWWCAFEGLERCAQGIAQDYRRLGESDTALKVLDLVNCFRGEPAPVPEQALIMLKAIKF